MIRIEAQGAVDVIRVDGALNETTVDELQHAWQEVLRSGAPMVVCDMSGINLIDSVGLEWLLDAQEEVAVRGGAMKLAGCPPLVNDILRVTGVRERFEVFETAGAGVGSFAR